MRRRPCERLQCDAVALASLDRYRKSEIARCIGRPRAGAQHEFVGHHFATVLRDRCDMRIRSELFTCAATGKAHVAQQRCRAMPSARSESATRTGRARSEA